MEKLEKRAVEYFVKKGEFALPIIKDGDVAIILTQDWCSEWKTMKGWLSNIPESQIKVWYYIYNDGSDVQKYKEKLNDKIPYIRYYSSGKLIKETNSVSQADFESAFPGLESKLDG